MNYQEYLDFAITLSKESAIIFKEGFFIDTNVEWKKDNDPVTEYDKKIEQLIRTRIQDKYPSHDVLGEEDGLDGGNSDFQWIVDPIDGTVNFIRKMPFVAISIALAYKGEVIAAVVANPMLDEYFWATKNGGAFLNGKNINASTIQNLRHSYIVFGRYQEKFSDIMHQFMKEFQSLRNPGSAALVMAYIAAGRIEGAIYTHLSPWDVAGGWLLITEAQGCITNLDGSDFNFENPSLLAGNKITHPHLLKAFQSAKL